jgi:hypothetical protein
LAPPVGTENLESVDTDICYLRRIIYLFYKPDISPVFLIRNGI